MSVDREALHRRSAALKAIIAAATPEAAPAPRRRALPAERPPVPAAARRAPPRRLLRIGERLRGAKGELRILLATGLELVGANRAFAASVRPPLHEHARIVRLDAEAWTVLVDSPAWASRLRFSIKAVRRGLEARLRRPVPELTVRVDPTTLPPHPRPVPRRIALSNTTVRALASAAAGIADPALAAALTRLAEHAQARVRRK